ncbi:MAG TPA: hypothetical protein VEU72_03450 [Nitrosopumilaceae archaeon]|nr:hypothetical protein [Nitrosopumilaceae archaeon]
MMHPKSHSGHWSSGDRLVNFLYLFNTWSRKRFTLYYGIITIVGTLIYIFDTYTQLGMLIIGVGGGMGFAHRIFAAKMQKLQEKV